MVAQRCPGVAHGVDADALRTVDVPQRRIAEACKPRCIDGIHRADSQGRGLAAGKLRRADTRHNHLVRNKNTARGGRFADGQRRADGGVIVGDLGFGQVVAHRRRPHKGQQRELYGTVAVVQDDLLRHTGETPGDVYTLPRQQAAGEIKPLGAVVVAGHGQHRDMPRDKLGQEPVQQRAGGRRRHGGVVDVTGQHDRLDAVFVADGKHLLQNKALILQHIKPIDPLAKVQVSQVQKLHRYFSKPRLPGMQGGVTSPRRGGLLSGRPTVQLVCRGRHCRPLQTSHLFSFTATIFPTW